jgi:hypothetical protein
MKGEKMQTTGTLYGQGFIDLDTAYFHKDHNPLLSTSGFKAERKYRTDANSFPPYGKPLDARCKDAETDRTRTGLQSAELKSDLPILADVIKILAIVASIPAYALFISLIAFVTLPMCLLTSENHRYIARVFSQD